MGNKIPKHDILKKCWERLPELLEIVEEQLNHEPWVRTFYFQYDIKITASVISEILNLAEEVKLYSEYPFDIAHNLLTHILGTFFFHETTAVRNDHHLALNLLDQMAEKAAGINLSEVNGSEALESAIDNKIGIVTRDNDPTKNKYENITLEFHKVMTNWHRVLDQCKPDLISVVNIIKIELERQNIDEKDIDKDYWFMKECIEHMKGNCERYKFHINEKINSDNIRSCIENNAIKEMGIQTKDPETSRYKYKKEWVIQFAEKLNKKNSPDTSVPENFELE